MWFKALGLDCPACGAKPHYPCRDIAKPHEVFGVSNPHFSRLLKAGELEKEKEIRCHA